MTPRTTAAEKSCSQMKRRLLSFMAELFFGVLISGLVLMRGSWRLKDSEALEGEVAEARAWCAALKSQGAGIEQEHVDLCCQPIATVLLIVAPPFASRCCWKKAHAETAINYHRNKSSVLLMRCNEMRVWKKDILSKKKEEKRNIKNCHFGP